MRENMLNFAQIRAGIRTGIRTGAFTYTCADAMLVAQSFGSTRPEQLEDGKRKSGYGKVLKLRHSKTTQKRIENSLII